MTTVLQAQALTKHYADLTAVQDLSLNVEEGEVFGLLGPNGAGKTTTINMLCGLLKPDSGWVKLRGKTVTNGDASIRTQVGICPQNVVVWGQLTCLEQLRFLGELYGLKAKDARIRGEQLLKDFNLLEKRNQLARTLSGGMQRRLNLAMALIHDPEILALDEPEAGMDPQSRVLVREYVRSLARRKTIILTTHNMDEADRMSDRVAILDHGKLLKVDTPESLKRTIGEGDVLEIEMKDEPAERALSVISRFETHCSASGQMLVVRTRGAVELLPSILEALKTAGMLTGEVRLRANTLEDVFITLTGRRLRE